MDEKTKRLVQAVIEKLVAEVNEQFEDSDFEYCTLYFEDVEEINDIIKQLGIDAQLKEGGY